MSLDEPDYRRLVGWNIVLGAELPKLRCSDSKKASYQPWYIIMMIFGDSVNGKGQSSEPTGRKDLVNPLSCERF